MVIPIKFPDEGFVAKTPTAPELSPVHLPTSLPGEDGIFLKLGPAEDVVFIRRNLYEGVILSKYFRLCFNNITPGGTYLLPNIDKENFEIIIKCLECGSISFSSLKQAIEILKISILIEYPTLCQEAVSYIDLNLNSENLLEIMEIIIPIHMNLIFQYKWNSNFFLDPGVENRLEIKSYIYALCTNCEIFSSGCAENILLSKRFLELDRKSAVQILYSLDLYIFDEMLLFNVINHWSKTELVGRNNEEKREIISRHVIFLVRYGLMSEKMFLEGPAASGLLLPDEIDIILKCIRKGKKKFKCPKDYSYMKRITAPRLKFNKCPFKLSSRTINGCTHFCYMRDNCESIKIEKDKDKQPPKVLCVFLRCLQILFD